MAIIDTQRFGVFQYEAFADVDDFRVERYLPTKAQDITISKYAMGHRAKYSISESEMMEFLDGLWAKSGGRSEITRNDLNKDAHATSEDFNDNFSDLGWPALSNPIKLRSPVERDGGGATYYYDPHSCMAYHRAAYW